MQYSITTALIAALLPSIALSAPLIPREDLATAADNWEADTSLVSSFLDTAPTVSGTTLTALASTALSNELNELTHKMVIDAQLLGTNVDIQGANNVLVTEGTFMLVVSGLMNLANNGASMSQAEIQGIVTAINLNRCTNVLPAIDTYLTQADPGAGLAAVRPTACSLTGLA